MIRRPPRSTRTDTLFPYTTLFRSSCAARLRMLFSSMLRKDVVDAKSMILGGIGITRAFAAYRTDKDIIPSAGGGSMITRSEELRVGKECVRTGRSRWSPYH